MKTYTLECEQSDITYRFDAYYTNSKVKITKTDYEGRELYFSHWEDRDVARDLYKSIKTSQGYKEYGV